jgi:23S rRNA (uracil1939-C5)-methyltransferase
MNVQTFKRSMLVRLKLTAMTAGGEAMGRDETGRVVFVPYAIAGEEVTAEIVEEKKHYTRTRLVEIVKPSPARVTPRCPHFAPFLNPPPPSPSPVGMGEGEGGPRGIRMGVGCGGCQWQHISYDAQLKFKTEIVREQFARIGKLQDAPVRETIGMPDPWHYRNNVQFQMDAEGRLCFRALESHDLVRIRECHILHPLLDEMFHALDFEGAEFDGVTLRAGTQTDQKMLVLEGRDQAAPEIAVDEAVSIIYQTPQGETISLIGKDALHEKLGGRAFRISPALFFQINSAMAGNLVELVERCLALRPSDVLLDAYGGVGTFGLLLAPRVARVIEVEENKSAIDDARANAVDLSNVEFHRGAVEDVLPKLKTQIDLAVADPPRAGLASRALDALMAHAPRALAYVSCDPATLARDARRLIDHDYHLIETQPVDMFPQTFHIETVSLFERG